MFYSQRVDDHAANEKKLFSIFSLFLMCLFSFFIFFIYEKSQAELNEEIQNLNDKVKKAGITQSNCPTCVELSGETNLPFDDGTMMKSCVDSLCTKKEVSQAQLMDKIYERAGRPDPTYDKEISPIVASIAKEGASNRLIRSQTILEWAKNPNPLKDLGSIRVFNLLDSAKHFSDFKIESKNGKLIVDSAQSRAAFPNLTDSEFKKKVAIANKIINAVKEPAIMETDPTQVQLFYPGAKFQNRVNEVLKSFKAKKEKIQKDPDLKALMELEEIQDSISEEKLREQFASAQQINPDLIQKLNSAYSTLNLLAAFSSDLSFKKLLDSPPIDVKKIIENQQSEALLKEQIAKQQSILNETNPNVSMKCKIAFAMAEETLPSQKELDAFKNKISDIKKQFLSRTKGFMCQEAAKKYEEELKTWEAGFPL